MTFPQRNSFDTAGCDLAVEVLRTYGSLRLGVTGWSMFPAVWPGDTIYIEATNISDVSEGDVVLFGREQRLFAHRVLRDVISGTGLLTRGDAMRVPDPPVSERELLGKVTAIERNGKCIDVRKRPRLVERAVSALIQRSEVASRVVVGVHGFRAASRVRTT